MITEEQKTAQLKERLFYFLQESTAAVDFCMAIVGIAHLWDDLIDKDKPVEDMRINLAFIESLVGIPCNSFYDQHRFLLQPIMLNTILQWMDANTLERSDSEHDRGMAWMLRASIIDVICFCSYLIGGYDWYIKVGPDIRRLYEETFNQFNEEMTNA